MNIYLVERVGDNHYGSYDGFICAADNEIEAKNYHPDGGSIDVDRNSVWVKLAEQTTCKLIGVADKEIKQGVIFSSFYGD